MYFKPRGLPRIRRRPRKDGSSAGNRDGVSGFAAVATAATAAIIKVVRIHFSSRLREGTDIPLSLSFSFFANARLNCRYAFNRFISDQVSASGRYTLNSEPDGSQSHTPGIFVLTTKIVRMNRDDAVSLRDTTKNKDYLTRRETIRCKDHHHVLIIISLYQRMKTFNVSALECSPRGASVISIKAGNR